MNYAIVEKESKRAIAIVDGSLSEWFAKNLPIFDQKEVSSVGSSTFVTEEGSINTISIQPIGTHLQKDCYHMINSKPDEVSLGEAYKLISK